jgi:hypothetical protein
MTDLLSPVLSGDRKEKIKRAAREALALRSSWKVTAAAAAAMFVVLCVLSLGRPAAGPAAQTETRPGQSQPATETAQAGTAAAAERPDAVKADRQGPYTEGKTKVFAVVGADNIEITKYVTAYAGGELCVDEDGLKAIFGLEPTDPKESDMQTFAQIEADSGLVSGTGGEFRRYENDTHIVVVKEGSNLCLADGRAGRLGIPVVIDGDKVSVPASSLSFLLGFQGVGKGVGDGSVTYTFR